MNSCDDLIGESRLPCCRAMALALSYMRVASDGKRWGLIARCTGCRNEEIRFCPWCGKRLPTVATDLEDYRLPYKSWVVTPTR
jgi:hypothetical protein